MSRGEVRGRLMKHDAAAGPNKGVDGALLVTGTEYNAQEVFRRAGVEVTGEESKVRM